MSTAPKEAGMPTVVLVGTLDTKGPDYAYLAERLRALGVDVLVVDAGTAAPRGLTPDVTADEVAEAAGTTVAELVSAGDRGAAVTAMGRGAAAVVGRLVAAGQVDGVLAAGGSGGSSIAAAVLAACPVGLPKLLVSTMASGDVSPYVGAKDVTIMYSVVDVAGVNRISRLVLGNAAAAMAGMARDRSRADTATDARPIVAASMFGVTTPAVEAAKARLEELGYEVLVFHATGAGGRALEGLAQAGLLAGVLDLTTTELADDLVGGVLTAGPDRLTAAGAAGVPQVIAPGALDMVNFGPVDTVPERFADRLFFVHNPTVTLMRTTADEMAELGRRIGAKAAAATGPTEVFWPDGGVSALDAPGQPFADPAADTACRDALAAALAAHGRTLHRVDAHVNAPEFAAAMADTLHRLIQKGA
ncbi:Tm-1-like ATP-binding domain-containing protein [Micromonospora haikouensis]|uniref:Tm-1-like ATP-binding domain-containing protein n=1 Tax=Micromonospora TaxID=1873 RepID=UPI001E454542|nr:Tm-1-like ATP-binding domain-containing protein [Micromonospora sp. NBRC 110038]